MMFRFGGPMNHLLVISLFVAFLNNHVGGVVLHSNFREAGKKDGIEIWRIEHFEPVPLPKNDYGKFHEGDSYILLSSKEDKSKKGTFAWDIHFWLGKSTSQDESGAAAILSVELDDALGGTPVQHREVQEHESEQFLKYFPSGVRYLPGGVASGFRHTEINAPGQKKLYKVKGKKNVRVTLVQLDAKSLNKGDCFILDAGNDIYVWVGSQAKGTERLKAISAANQIRDQDHNGRAKVQVVDSSSTANEVNQFFSILGSGSATQVANPTTPDDDQEYEKKQDAIVALYKVSDATGKLVAEQLPEKPLKRSSLKSEDCFILDTVTSGIYVWVGRGSTTKEKVEALARGQAFLKDNNYPDWTQMQRVIEGGEPTAFKEYFDDWRDSQLAGGIGRG
ncbi:actin depolymerising venom protein gelsolin 1-like [Rhodnius prolixus]|uniref:actin depolymerising venom protein gelsolin 1-like n=1 Tax=Rhodnius prolixus TaxID=13249 RepID=UPI003D18CFC9